MEEPLLITSRRKMVLLAASLPIGRSPVLCHSRGFKESTTNQVPASTRFIEEGIHELIKVRRILCGSYVYGYYLEDNGYNKTIFEFMQVTYIYIYHYVNTSKDTHVNVYTYLTEDIYACYF